MTPLKFSRTSPLQANHYKLCRPDNFPTVSDPLLWRRRWATEHEDAGSAGVAAFLMNAKEKNARLC